MVGKYKVITLCGSTKFRDNFLEVQRILTMQGYIVLSVGVFGHYESPQLQEQIEAIKPMLDDMHKRKIDMADAIYVVNVGGYIGESTKGEIEYAKQTGKEIFYLENH